MVHGPVRVITVEREYGSAGNVQEVTGISPGQKVVANALPLQATVEQ